MNLKKFLLLIPLAALALVLIVYAAIWFSGTRYVRYESEEYGKIRYVGKLNEDGLPANGKVYYSDGKKADLSEYTETLEFRNGSATVKGDLFKLEYSDGNSYIGELQGLIRDGKGILTFTGGDVYEGEFVFGAMTGSGSYYYKNGDVYTGDFKDGVKWGHGTYVWAAQNGSGDRYEGEYHANMRHGRGVYTYADGSYYDGQYENDAKSGKGIMTFASGDRYEGDFAGDLRSGKGVYTFASGDSYEGDFYRGQITGFGTYHWASGERPDYTGYFENGVIVTVVPDPSQPGGAPETMEE